MDAIDVVRRYIDLLGQRDLDALDEVVAEDVVVLYPDGSVAYSDRQSWKQAQRGSPFSDERITPVQIVSDGEQVVRQSPATASGSSRNRAERGTVGGEACLVQRAVPPIAT